jgi:hypothetical protein
LKRENTDVTADATLMRRFVSLLLVLALCLPVTLADAPPAIAQDGLAGTGIGKIFRKLRERFRQPNRRVIRKSRRKTGRKTTRRQSPTASSATEPEVAIAEKLGNARTILVVGDFLASGTAEGLERAFQASPGVRVVDRASGSSGFVRSDFYNWPAEIGPIIDEEKPAVAVVMLGSNDRQSLYIVDRNEPVRSDAWLKEYESRVTALANAIRAKRVPLIWVGMPSFKFAKMSADMLALNDVYRSVTERSGGIFVDIWDGFVNENNEFVRSGPDINGQTVRLRSSDGINMTAAGKRKIAFYAEKPLRKLLGPAAAPDIGVLGPQGLDAVSLDPSGEGARPGRTVPIALTDPALDGGIELLGGGSQQPKRSTRLPGEKLAVEGIAPEPLPGRADNFSTRREPDEPPPVFVP